MPKKKTNSEIEQLKKSSLDKYLVDFTDEDLNILKKRALQLARENKEKREKKLINVTVFQLSGERYAVESEYVLETIKLQKFTTLPTGPNFLFGFINHRGNVIAILDLKVFFELKGEKITDLNRIVILSKDDISFGILVDRIEGVIELDEDSLTKEIATIEGIRKEYFKGITSDDIIYLDAGKILQDEKLIINE